MELRTNPVRFNIRNLELDQLAVRALHDPVKRPVLMKAISPLDNTLTHWETEFGKGFLIGRFVPEGMLFRHITGCIDGVISCGGLEYSKIIRDRRGHFFFVGGTGNKLENSGDAIFAVSHYVANMWAAASSLHLVEDVGRSVLAHYMRMYSSYDAPDIGLEDIDIILIKDRPPSEIDGLIDLAREDQKAALREKLVRIPAEGDSRITDSIRSHAVNSPLITGYHGDSIKDSFQALFWLLQPGIYGTSPVEMIRKVIGADPSFWGKPEASYFDPLGIINYAIKTGRTDGQD